MISKTIENRPIFMKIGKTSWFFGLQKIEKLGKPVGFLVCKKSMGLNKKLKFKKFGK
jgi:hypothetical protein